MNLSLIAESHAQQFRSPSDALAWEFRDRDDGSYTSSGFQEDEFPLSHVVKQKLSGDKLCIIGRSRLSCPSLEEALGKIVGTRDDLEAEIDIGILRGLVWRNLWWQYKGFHSRLFDWMKMARTWRDIEVLFLAGEEISEIVEMSERFNMTVNVWLNYGNYGARR